MKGKHTKWTIKLDPWAASYLKFRATEEKKPAAQLLQEWAIDALEEQVLSQFADACDAHEETVWHEEAWRR